MSSHEHKDFFQHYGSILAEEHSHTGLPQTMEAFENTLNLRAPFLTEAERAGILTSIETKERKS